MYNNYNNSPNLMISIGSVVSSQQNTFFNKATYFFLNLFMLLSLKIIWSLNGTHWHLAELEFLLCKWMVQNILIDIWITSQAGVWGVCPPTNRKKYDFCMKSWYQKNFSSRSARRLLFFFTLTWNPGYAPVS